MKASEALSISIDAQSNNLNYQRVFIIDKIRTQALYGKRELVVDFPHVRLFDDDWLYFENLGYSVKRPDHKMLVPINMSLDEAMKSGKVDRISYFGMIRW